MESRGIWREIRSRDEKTNARLCHYDKPVLFREKSTRSFTKKTQTVFFAVLCRPLTFRVNRLDLYLNGILLTRYTPAGLIDCHFLLSVRRTFLGANSEGQKKTTRKTFFLFEPRFSWAAAFTFRRWVQIIVYYGSLRAALCRHGQAHKDACISINTIH